MTVTETGGRVAASRLALSRPGVMRRIGLRSDAISASANGGGLILQPGPQRFDAGIICRARSVNQIIAAPGGQHNVGEKSNQTARRIIIRRKGAASQGNAFAAQGGFDHKTSVAERRAFAVGASDPGGRKPSLPVRQAAKASRRAPKQPHPKIVFKRPDLAADRAGGHMQLARRQRHAAETARRLKGAQGLKRRQKNRPEPYD